jgi:pimeloyl-ACP methyl ester carboxylesterase
MITSVNGHAIGYDDVGTGLPMLYIHGFPHDRTLWAPQAGATGVPTRMIASDLRGFGESAGVAESIDDYATDVIVLARQLGVVKAVVVGLSMGGYVAFAIWRKDPALARGLVLCSTRAGADNDAARAKRNEQIEFAKTRGTAALADVLVKNMVGKSTRAQRPDLTESVHAMLARAPLPGVLGALSVMRDRPDSTPTLSTVTVPTLIIVGDEDTIIPIDESRAMHEAIPGSTLQIVSGAGHLPNVERPAAFNHVLSEFLASMTLT